MNLRDALITQANALSQNNPYVPFGAGAKQEAQRHRAAKNKPQGAVALSITGKSAPEYFTPAELRDIANNSQLAEKIFREYTGKPPTREDIDGLRSRIQETYPEVMQPTRPEGLRESFQKAHEAMGRRENPDIKPMVDFFANNPEIAKYGGRGRPEDASLFRAAQQLRDSGYGQQPTYDDYGRRNFALPANNAEIEAIKQRANLFTLPRNRGGYREILENIGRPPNQIRSQRKRTEIERLSAPIRQREQQATQSRERDLPVRMREASRLEKLASMVEKGADRIAPLNELHDQAKGLLQRNLDPESLDLARKEAVAASKMDVSRDVQPYLERASESPDEFINQYENRYEQVIDDFRKEAAQDFLEQDMPKINRQFASKGAFHSGAREKALNKARADKEQRIEREISRLKAHGRDEAMKHYHQHRKHTLDTGEIAGKMRGATQDATLRAAESLRNHALSGKDAAHKDASALEQLARTEQQQAQNAINVRMAEHREQQERPWLELERKSAIAAGHPLQPVQYSPDVMNPAPPNVYGMGAGLLGQMAGLQRMQGQSYRKGGHVRARYADGGSVARTAAELKQMEQHTQGPNPYEQEMLSEGRGIRDSRIDPMGRYMFTLGSHMIANNRGDPLKAYGEGSMHGMQAADQAHAHNLTAKEKYLNLLGKINESRSTQQKYFSQYHLNKMSHEENVRAHHATLAETRRHHDLMHQKTQENATLGNPHLPSFASKEAEKAFYKREGKLKEKFDEDRGNTDKLGKSTKRMMKLFDKGIGPTGPYVGSAWGIPDPLLNMVSKPETIANRRLFEKEFTKNVLDIMNQAKGNQTDADREYMSKTTVSLKDDPVTIKRYLEDADKLIKRNEEAIHYIEAEMDKGVPIEEAQKKWKKYVEENPLFSDEEGNSPTNTASEGSGMVQIIDPDGVKWTIPKGNLKESINRGAKVL